MKQVKAVGITEPFTNQILEARCFVRPKTRRQRSHTGVASPEPWRGRSGSHSSSFESPKREIRQSGEVTAS